MLHVLYLQQTKTEDNQLNETKALQKVIRQANKKNESAKQSWIESTKNTPKSQQQTKTKKNNRRNNKKNKNQTKQTKIKEQNTWNNRHSPFETIEVIIIH